jgi:hypothetical protein
MLVGNFLQGSPCGVDPFCVFGEFCSKIHKLGWVWQYLGYGLVSCSHGCPMFLSVIRVGKVCSLFQIACVRVPYIF